MPDHRPVSDEDILSGFASLHEAMLAGFAAMQAQFVSLERRFAQVDDRFAAIDRQFSNLESGLRSELARFEHRMLRRFDDLEGRLAKLEAR